MTEETILIDQLRRDVDEIKADRKEDRELVVEVRVLAEQVKTLAEAFQKDVQDRARFATDKDVLSIKEWSKERYDPTVKIVGKFSWLIIASTVTSVIGAVAIVSGVLVPYITSLTNG